MALDQRARRPSRERTRGPARASKYSGFTCKAGMIFSSNDCHVEHFSVSVPRSKPLKNTLDDTRLLYLTRLPFFLNRQQYAFSAQKYLLGSFNLIENIHYVIFAMRSATTDECVEFVTDILIRLYFERPCTFRHDIEQFRMLVILLLALKSEERIAYFCGSAITLSDSYNFTIELHQTLRYELVVFI